MILNIILLLVGAALFIYGLKTKTKFFMIAGAVLIGFGVISAGVDYFMGGTGEADSYRLPFLIDAMMK